MFLKLLSDSSYKYVFHAFCVASVTNFSTLKVAIFASPFCRSYVKFYSCFFSDGPVMWQPLQLLFMICLNRQLPFILKLKGPLYTGKLHAS